MAAIALSFQPQPPAFGSAFRGAGLRFGHEGSARQFNSQVPNGAEPTMNRQGEVLNPLQRVFQKMIRWYQRNDFIHETLYKPRYVTVFGSKIQVYGGLQCFHKRNGVSSISCSEYGAEAIREKGALKGSWLTLGRVLSCNPWTAKPGSKIGQRFSQVV